MERSVLMIRSIACRTVVCSVAFAVYTVLGVDTRDYSTYVRLYSYVKVTNNWPAAECWNPKGEMNDDGYYLVIKGVTLASSTSSAMIQTLWPGRELAIAGTFRPTASGGRQGVAITPRLAILPGGKLSIGSAYGTVKGDTVDIRGTADNPSIVDYDYSYSDKETTGRYAQLDIAFTGDRDSVVKFTRSAHDIYDFVRAFRVTGGFANFLGTMILEGEHVWLRPETSATSFDVGGTIELRSGANLYIATLAPKFGTFVMGEGTTLDIDAGRYVTVTNSFTIADGCRIKVRALPSTAWVTDDGVKTPPEIPVISVCGAENAAAVDRNALLSAIVSGSESFKDSMGSGIPRIKIVERVRDDGGVDFLVSHHPVVKLIKGCSANESPFGSDGFEYMFSDGQPISPEKDYVSIERAIYFDGTNYEFPGNSLTLSKHTHPFGFYSAQRFHVNDLRLLDGAWFRSMAKNAYAYLSGAVNVIGDVEFCMSGNKKFGLEASLSGAGDIRVLLDVEKILDKASAWVGTLELSGDNSAYAGRFLVGFFNEEITYKKEMATTNLTLKVSSGSHLGGSIEEFTYDAVKIAKTCTLSVSGIATFNAKNRGWCLLDGASVEVAEGKVATMCESVTFGGTSTKKGRGTLILGGGAKFYDAENDAAVDEPNGAGFHIAEGALGVTSADALRNVAVSFSKNARLVAVAGAAGLSLTSLPVVEGDILRVEISKDPEAVSGSVDIITLPASVPFDSSKLSVARPSGFGLGGIKTRIEGENVVYYTTFKKLGLSISIR